jgi:U6 snRNA phosphodiesterase
MTTVSFEVTVTSLDWVSNFERNRWFLVMRLSRPDNDGLNKLLGFSNETLAAFGQPPLYDKKPSDRHRNSRSRGQARGRGGRWPTDTSRNGSHMLPTAAPTDCSSHFHISIAWRLGEPTSETKGKAKDMGSKELEDFCISFNNMKVKIGNAVYSMSLPSGTMDEKGFGGL